MQGKLKIKKGDMVTVITGNDKGKRGKVLKVQAQKRRLVIEKVNMVKRHSRPSSMTRQGGIIEKEAPIQISNVMLVCPKCDDKARVKTQVLEDGKRVRSCGKCGELLDKT